MSEERTPGGQTPRGETLGAGGIPRATGGPGDKPSPRPRFTAPRIIEMKRRGDPIVVVTAYDFPTARIADEAGAEILLVGDSLGTVVLGYESTLPVTVEDILHHTRAVVRARPSALVVADKADSIASAIRLAEKSIDSGAAADALEKLIRISNS